MKFAVLVLLIAVGAFAGNIRAAVDPKTVLSEINNTPFGKGILSLVAVQLSTNGPMEEIITSLGQIALDLTKSQEKADEDNRTEQAECDTEIANFQQQIASFTAQRNENIQIRDVNKAALAIAQKDLRETLASLATNKKRSDEGQAEREEQHNEYATRLSDLENGIHALDAALQLLQHLQAGSASFVQLKKRFDKVMTELVEVSEKSHKGHLYTPLVSALADLAQKASPEVITKIIGLFNELRHTFVQDQQTDTNVENAQQQAWTSLKADLDTEREQLNDHRAELERQIANYEKIIAAAEENIRNLTAQIEIATENLNRTIEVCAEESARYERDTRERARESDIISRVISFFETRAKGAADFIKSNVEAESL